MKYGSRRFSAAAYWLAGKLGIDGSIESHSEAAGNRPGNATMYGADVAQVHVEFVSGAEADRSFGHQSTTGYVPDAEDAGSFAVRGRHLGVQEHAVTLGACIADVLLVFHNVELVSSTNEAPDDAITR